MRQSITVFELFHIENITEFFSSYFHDICLINVLIQAQIKKKSFFLIKFTNSGKVLATGKILRQFTTVFYSR